MGDDGSVLVQLEEKEGETELSDDFMVRTIGASVPLFSSKEGFDGENAPAQGLSISERLGLIFVARPGGFFVANTKDVFSSAKDIKESNNASSIQEQSIADVSLAGLSRLALSSDSSTLAACSGGELHFFSTDSLLKKVEEPFMSRELHTSAFVKDFQWNKSGNTAYVVLSSDGVLYHGDMQAQHTSVAENVAAVDWSVEGDFIAISRRSSIFILSSHFKEKCHMQLPFPSQENGTTMEVDSIKWVRQDSIVIGCSQSVEEGIGSGYLVQVITSNDHDITEASSDVVIQTFDNFFLSLSESILPFGSGPSLFMHYFKLWELALAANRKSVDDHIVLLGWLPDDNLKEPKVIDFLNDKWMPRIQMQVNGDENIVVGFGVDVNFDDGRYEIELDSGGSRELAYCVMLCLTVDGMLTLFRVARRSAPISTPLRDGCLGEQSSKCLVVQNEPSTVISRPRQNMAEVAGKDDHSPKSDTGMAKPISTQKPELKTAQDTSSTQIGKEQSSERSHATANLVPLNFQQSVVENSDTSPQVPGLGNFVNTGIQKSLPSMKPETEISQHASQLQAKVEQRSETSNGTTKLGFLNFQSSAVVSSNKSPQVPELGSSLNMGVQKPFSSTTRIADIGGHAMQNNSLVANKSSSQSSPKVKEQEKGLLEQRISCPDMKSSSASSQHSDLVGSAQGFSRFSQKGSLSSTLLDQKGPGKLDARVKLHTPVVMDSEAEFSKAFENVREIAEELDRQFSTIEGHGGYGDSDMVFRKDCVLAIEESIRSLSKRCREWKNKVDGRLEDIQNLQNGAMQAIAKEVHIKSIIRQSSNSRYWELWNRQKLRPEFENKRQQLLKTKQNLIKQLRDLERHFNVLELNKFGDQDIGSRSQTSMELSRRGQELQRLYNTMNSQLSASNQLSECLSRQMAALNIAPCNVKQQEIKKELFESIGLNYDDGLFKSPHVKGNGSPSQLSKKPLFPSLCTLTVDRISKAANIVQYFEPETTRRRRDSMDTNLVGFDPPKTVVKRMLMEEFADDTADKFIPERSRKFSNSQLEPGLVESPETMSLHRASATRGLHNQYPANIDLQTTRVSETSPSPFFKWSKSNMEPSQNSGSVSRGVLIPKSNDLPPAFSAPSLSNLNSRIVEGEIAYQGQGAVVLGTSAPGTSQAGFVAKTEPRDTGSNFNTANVSGSSRISSTITDEGKLSAHASLQGTTISAGPGRMEGANHNDKLIVGHNLPTINPVATLSKDVLAPNVEAFSSMLPANSSGKSNQLTQSMELVQSDKSVPAAIVSLATAASFPASTSPGTLSVSAFSSSSSASKFDHAPQINRLPSIPSTTDSKKSSQSNANAAEAPSTKISPTVTDTQPAVLVSPPSTPIQVSCQASPSFGSVSAFSSVHVSSFSPPVVVSTQSNAPSSQSESLSRKSSSILSPVSVEVNPSKESPPKIGLPLGPMPQLSQEAKPPSERSASVSVSPLETKSVSTSSSLALSSPSSSSLPTMHVSSAVIAQKTDGHTSKTAILPTPAVTPTSRASTGLSFGTQPTLLSTSNFNMFGSTSGVSSGSQHTTVTSTVPNEIMDTATSQEDDMEEEASELTTELNLGSLGGFGLGSTISNVPKSNPFGSSLSGSTQSSTAFSWSVPPGELFKPASFSLPAAQTSQPSGSNLFSGPFNLPAALSSQPSGSNLFSGPFGQQNTMSGNNAFGQPASTGPGQQALGSVLGSFGQSRQLGASLPGAGFPSSSAFGGGFAASSAPGSGFARAATGGGFAALASSGGGFAAAATAAGAFHAFSSNSGGVGFGSTNAASNPLPDRFTQMRK